MTACGMFQTRILREIRERSFLATEKNTAEEKDH